jgi:hypothetical protein
VISQPFWPAYLTAERIAKAPDLKLAVSARIGSDHVDLQAAIDGGITVAEVTYCNSISVSEHVVMAIFALVRKLHPVLQWVVDGGWNIADCVSRSYNLEGRCAPWGPLAPFPIKSMLEINYPDPRDRPRSSRARSHGSLEGRSSGNRPRYRLGETRRPLPSHVRRSTDAGSAWPASCRPR